MIVLALAALIAALGVVWLVWLRPPATTPFGWAADLTTVAGDGTKGHVDGATGRARFSDPFALAFGDDGTLYVADADRIRRIAPDGRTTTLPGRFATPSGLAIDRGGNVIVADTGANAIRRIAPDGTVTTLAGDGTPGFRDGPAKAARFNGPIGVAVDGEGNVFVADSYNDRIRVITTDGKVRTLAGGGAQALVDGQGTGAAFDTPCGLLVEPDGALLVADTGNDAIRRVGKDGRVTTLARSAPDDGNGLLREPIGLARTWDGFVYVSSYRRGRILQMSPSGQLRALTGPGVTIRGNAALRLGTPAGLALDRKGALYVADAARYAVRKLGPRTGTTAKGSTLPAGLPALVRAASVPWPVKPQTAWHEVVGTLGEVRGNYQGEPRDHLHAGLDISAGVGDEVVAIADETVVDPLPNWSIDGLSEGLRIDTVTYIHMRVGRTAAGAPLDPARFALSRDAAGRLSNVRVKRGTRFRVGDPLGTINRMAHVHLELGPPGSKVNALMLRFPGFTDRFVPRIDGIQVIDASGRRLTEQQAGRLIVPASGAFQILVDAWDQVDGNAPRRRLGLYRAGFQILRANGSSAPGFAKPLINLRFDRMPLDRQAAKVAFAAESGDVVHSDQATRFLYVVTNSVAGGEAVAGAWRPAGLPRGDYIIRILAADHAGNAALANRDLPIAVP